MPQELSLSASDSPPTSHASTPCDVEIPEPTYPAVDRRGSDDRRSRRTRPWGNPFGWKRRESGRRAGEQQNYFVDRYHKRDTAMLVAILVLNLLDAFLTLIHIERGGAEANPLMDRLLDAGNETFLFHKAAVVGSLLLVLVVHKNFAIARRAMWIILGVYSLLFVYHLTLQIWAIYPNG